MSNFEILASGPSPLGLLCLRRRELISDPGTVITEVTLNHEFLMSSYHTESERALATSAVKLHGGEGLAVLVGGLGLGYTAAAVLETERAASVEVVEYLPDVIEWMESGLVPLSDTLAKDARLKLTAGDVYGLLAGPPAETYDLILIDVDHSPDERLDTGPGFFYTREGLALAKQHLEPQGVLAVWSYAESSSFSEALADVFSEVLAEPVSFENRLTDQVSTDWLFFARD